MATRKTAKKAKAPARAGKKAAPPITKNPLRGSSAAVERGTHYPEVGDSTSPPATIDDDTFGLSPKHLRFAREYLIDRNAGKAYTRAGYGAAGSSADSAGNRLLRNVQIQQFLNKSEQRIAARVELTAEMVVARLREIVFADPRELVEYKVYCCRHCHGIDYQYQWTLAEQKRAIKNYSDAMEDGRRKKVEAPDFSGGACYDPRRAPNPDCPDCKGNGYGEAVFKDTRGLSAGAAALYAGVKQTKEGIEVKVHNQLEAAEKLAKHLGVYALDNKQKADGLSDLLAGIGRSALPVVKDPAP